MARLKKDQFWAVKQDGVIDHASLSGKRSDCVDIREMDCWPGSATVVKVEVREVTLDREEGEG